jgi:hypothetical protein
LGFPVSLQLFVLVTSVAPLRAYLYGEGIVSFRHGEENGYRKVTATGQFVPSGNDRCGES